MGETRCLNLILGLPFFFVSTVRYFFFFWYSLVQFKGHFFLFCELASLYLVLFNGNIVLFFSIFFSLDFIGSDCDWFVSLKFLLFR